jgi:predicted nucleic acid-binding protein
MTNVFADTFSFLAQFNPADAAHGKATAFTNSFSGHMVTTDWVIVELADAFAQLPNRARFVTLYEQLQLTPELTIVPAERALLRDGFALYATRPDMEWSLTDCISFVVMTREGITEALTGDRHFEQAGFVALLK